MEGCHVIIVALVLVVVVCAMFVLDWLFNPPRPLKKKRRRRARYSKKKGKTP